MMWCKPAFFHSGSPSEAVLFSHFGKWCTETESQMQEGDTDRCGLGQSRGSEVQCFENELSWDQRNSQTKVLFPTPMDILLFSLKVPTCPQLGAHRLGPASVIQPKGCQVTPFPPGACPHQAKVGVCWGETWWRRFTITSTTHNAVENRHPKLQRSAEMSRAMPVLSRGQDIPRPLTHVMDRAEVQQSNWSNSNPRFYLPLLL